MSAGQVLFFWVAGSIAATAALVCACEAVDQFLSRRARRRLHESARRHPSGKWTPEQNPQTFTAEAVVIADSEWARWDHEAAVMNTPIYDGVADEHAALIAELDLQLLARAFEKNQVDDALLHEWMGRDR